MAVDFYTRVLGFEIERDERTTDWPYVALRLGQVLVGAAARPAISSREHRRPPTGVELVLEVADLDAAHSRVRDSHWPFDADLADQPWGLRDFRVLDPDGYYWRVTNGLR